MNLIFDSHAHYDDKAFNADRDELIQTLPDRGVCAVVNASVNFNTCKASLRLAEKYPYFYAAVGYHPEHAAKTPKNYIERLRRLCVENKKVCAVGEIGLDYHYENAPSREVQINTASEQIMLANELDMPIVFHDRDAHSDTMELLKKYKPKGLVHCFSGSVEMLKEVIKLGLFISLGGVVTFKNARIPLEVAQAVPLDRLLLETDAPYMTPVPYRGKRCDSSMIIYTAEKIAALRGITTDQLLCATKENACRLYKIEL